MSEPRKFRVRVTIDVMARDEDQAARLMKEELGPVAARMDEWTGWWVDEIIDLADPPLP